MTAQRKSPANARKGADRARKAASGAERPGDPVSGLRPYGDAVDEYLERGWSSPIPLGHPGQRHKKSPVPKGVTGRPAKVPTDKQIDGWKISHAVNNIGLHLVDGQIGIDVDQYGEKRGGDLLAELEAELGALPPCHRSSARPLPSGIRVFKVPPGIEFVSKLRGGIDIVQARIRYMAVSPSVHPETGDTYTWYAPSGKPMKCPPLTDRLAELPDAWVDYLRVDGGTGVAREFTELREAEAEDWLRKYGSGQMCRAVRGVLKKQLAELADPPEAHYDTMVHGAWALVSLAAEGHHGVCEALSTFEEAYEDYVADKPHRDPTEWGRALVGAVAKVAGAGAGAGAEVDRHPDGTCPSGDGAGDGRPEIDVTNGANLLDLLREQIGVGPLTGLFLRGDQLVRVLRIGEDGYMPPQDSPDHDGRAQIHGVDPKSLRYLVQLKFWSYRWSGRADDKTKSHAAPTVATCEDALRAAVHGDCPNLPSLAGVTHTPLVRADGTVFDFPGYDPGTRLLYLPDDLVLPPVPKRPTQKQLRAARDGLLYVVQDFGFASESDRANYLGLLLTPLLRLLVPGPRPLGVLNAHMAGSGKTLLASIFEHLYGTVVRSEPGDDDEIRKTVTALLLTTTAPVVTWDNVRRTLRSAVLEKLLTGDTWSDRVLGLSKETGKLPNDRLWLATGNNVSLGGDLLRRGIWVTIDPNVPRPWTRGEGEFAEPDLGAYVTKNRGELLAALLTLVRGWVSAGSPGTYRRSDVYRDWARAVSGVLLHGGVPGEFWAPETDRAEVGADDDEWHTFLAAVHVVFGDEPFTAKAVIERIERTEAVFEAEGEADTDRLAEALPEELQNKLRFAGGSTAKSLGKWFGNRDGRFAGDYVARAAGNDGHGTKLWRILKKDQQ